MTWLFNHAGLNDGSGAVYLFWSGICGDLFIVGAFAGLYKKLNCQATGCWRIGVHHVEGTPYTTCRKHHPVAAKKSSAAHIKDAHHQAATERELRAQPVPAEPPSVSHTARKSRSRKKDDD